MVIMCNVPLLGVGSVAAYRGGVDADGALQRRGRAALRRAGLDLRRNLEDGGKTVRNRKMYNVFVLIQPPICPQL